MALTKITTNIIADNAITADKIDSSSLNTALSSASGYNNTNWDTAYGWGNHGAEGYLTTVSFTDLTGKPTTLSGYGITDAFSGSYNDLSDTPTLFSGSYTDLSDKPTLFSGSYTDLSDKPTIPTVPTTVSSFTNDSNYATQTYVNTAVSDLVDNSPETLDTLNELAAALGDDPNFAATTAASIGTKWTQDNTKISNWDTAYGWGNHASAGYLTAHQDISGKADLSGDTFTGKVIYTGRTTDSAGTSTYVASDATLTRYMSNIATEYHSGASGEPVTIYFKSGVNAPSDFGYITFDPKRDDGSERAELVIGCENDGVVTSGVDRVKIASPLVIDSKLFTSDHTKIVEFHFNGVEKGYITTAGNLQLDGSITASGYNASNWNTAYTYSQVGHLPLSGGGLTGNIGIAVGNYLGYSNSYNYKPYIQGGIGTRSELISAANFLIHADTDGSGATEFVSIRAGAGTANELKLLSKTSSAGVDNNALSLNGNTIWNAGNFATGSDTRSFGALQISSSTGNITFANSGTTKRGVYGTMGDNDQWFIGGGATSSNVGYLEISTGDDGQSTTGGCEEILVRQYGPGNPLTGTLHRTLKLLDKYGNTSIPGNVSAAGFIYNSDKAFKENIEPLENSLDTILKLEGVKYTLKESGKSSIGFIAQDVEKVIPEFVEGDEGSKGVNYGQMVAVLTEAMKEQQAQIDSQNEKIENLTNLVNTLLQK